MIHFFSVPPGLDETSKEEIKEYWPFKDSILFNYSTGRNSFFHVIDFRWNKILYEVILTDKYFLTCSLMFFSHKIINGRKTWKGL